MLLYAQPVSRLTRLTIDDIHHHDGQTLLRFGDPPSPVPEPFAALLSQLAATRSNMNTAANPAARWLFPGGRPGQPLTPGALLPSLRHLGIPITKARTAALRELILQAPAPVIAKPSATATPPPTATSPTPAEPETNSPRSTSTQSNHRNDIRRKHATIEYDTVPVKVMQPTTSIS